MGLLVAGLGVGLGLLSVALIIEQAPISTVD